MLYRIYTEDVNRHRVEAIAQEFFQGFTVLQSTGFWEGSREESVVIEVIGDESLRPEVTACAEAIKDANSQEAVLVQALQNDSWLV